MKRTLSFAAGLVLALLAVLWSIAGPALQTERFEKAVLNTVNREAVGMSESDLTAFARETMDYLNGRADKWSPDTPFEISPAFVRHMAEVRGWVDALKIALPAGAALSVLLLMYGRDGQMARLGMLTLLGLIAAVLVWAAIDFDSLWMVIHRVLIPGGIFAAGEMVMRLFPLELFFSYVGAVALRLAGWMLLVGGITWFLPRIRFRVKS